MTVGSHSSRVDADGHNGGQGQEGSQPRPVGSYPPTGIDVVIVGTGLAGLTAAIECVRKGHNVKHLLERNSSINVAGDTYFNGLPATRFFKHWPEMAAEFDAISLHDAWISTHKHSGEQMIKPLRVAERLKAQGLDPGTPPGTFQMRPLVYKMFLKQAEKLGIQIEYNRRVVDYTEDEATGRAAAVTDDGQRYEGDIVIAADGVGSKAQKLVGGQVRARPSGRAMWRAAFPIEVLDKDPEVKEYFGLHTTEDGEKKPIVRAWLGPSTYGLTLTRPETIIWIVNHDVSGNEAESWSDTISNEEVLHDMAKMEGPKWSPLFQRLVAATPPNTIINFELLWRNPQPTWVSPQARVIQIGDAAHSFLPASGNGATMAIEDGVSLAACLQLAGSPAAVPDAVRAQMRLRFTRVACAQKLGFANADLLQDTKWEEAKVDMRKATPRHPAWVFAHDPETYAIRNYARAVREVRDGVELADSQLEENYPRGYRYVPWSIERIIEDKKAGREVDLGAGDWS